MIGVRLVVTLVCAVALLALPGAASAGRWVAGDLHVHTTYSHDSYGGPADDKTRAEDLYTPGPTVTDDLPIPPTPRPHLPAASHHKDLRSPSGPPLGPDGGPRLP